MDTDDLLQEALELHRKGDVAGAVQRYTQILLAEPKHFATRLNLASIALDEGKLPEAAKLLDALLKEDDKSGVGHLLRARTAFLIGDQAAGVRHIKQAHALMPEDDGVTTEYVAAMRRTYFTFDVEEYDILVRSAREGAIKPARRQRLAQLAFTRLVRPDVVALITEPGLPQGSPDAVTRWQDTLPLDKRSDVTLLAAELSQRWEDMKKEGIWSPQRANIHVRRRKGEPEKEPAMAEAFTDADSLTAGSLEIVRHDNLEFVPFGEIASIEFGEPGVVVDAFVTLRGGRTISGLCPMFYLLTEFAKSKPVLQGKTTLFRAVLPGLVCGVGLRSFADGQRLMPMSNVERIDFKS
ncbi:MAG: tetratricopeptide repeat protein [Planctomycetes bacterium]|nr:tetratricopeptide repeat protein [Planctomycetota bacterium]